MMKAEYTISEDDYVRAMKLFSRFTPKGGLILGLIFLVLILAAAFAPQPVKSGAIGGLIGGGVTLVLVRYLLSPILARRHYRKYKSIQLPINIELKDEGIEFSSADGGGVVRWQTIFKWRHDEHYLLVYPMPRLYYIIPRTIATAGFDLPALLHALEIKVGKAR